MDCRSMFILLGNISLKLYLAIITYKYVFKKKVSDDYIYDGPIDYTKFYRR